MKTISQRILPEEFVLSVLSPEQRLNAAFKLCASAFKKTKLSIKDIEEAVTKIRKKINAKK